MISHKPGAGSTRTPGVSGTGSSRLLVEHGLRVPEALERLAALEVVRAKLLSKIGKVKASLERLTSRVRDTATTVATTMLPLLFEVEELKTELHRLFRELLVRRRLPRASAEVVADVYDILIETGFLEPPDEFDADEAPTGPTGMGPDAGDSDRTVEDAEERDAFADAGESSFNNKYGLPDEHPSATPKAPTDPAMADALRAVFRRLARALHPDGVQDVAEQALRTEAMKEITQAHRMHDLARLLELECRWLASGTLVSAAPGASSATDETARRCQELADFNDLLRGQIRELERELRKLRKSEPAQMLNDLKRSDRERGMPAGTSAKTLTAEGTAERDRYLDVRNLVRDFRDGKATLAQLRKGPLSFTRMHVAPAPDGLFETDDPEELQDLIEQMAKFFQSGSGKRSRSAQGGPARTQAKARAANKR